MLERVIQELVDERAKAGTIGLGADEQIGDRAAAVRRRDRRERHDPIGIGETFQVRAERVSRVEAAHAVRDDVDRTGGEPGADLVGEGLGSSVDRRRHRHVGKQRVGIGPAYAAKVVEPRDVLRNEDAGCKDEIHIRTSSGTR